MTSGAGGSGARARRRRDRRSAAGRIRSHPLAGGWQTVINARLRSRLWQDIPHGGINVCAGGRGGHACRRVRGLRNVRENGGGRVLCRHHIALEGPRVPQPALSGPGVRRVGCGTGDSRPVNYFPLPECRSLSTAGGRRRHFFLIADHGWSCHAGMVHSLGVEG